jgi:hypothetical protein
MLIVVCRPPRDECAPAETYGGRFACFVNSDVPFLPLHGERPVKNNNSDIEF